MWPRKTAAGWQHPKPLKSRERLTSKKQFKTSKDHVWLTFLGKGRPRPCPGAAPPMHPGFTWWGACGDPHRLHPACGFLWQLLPEGRGGTLRWRIQERFWNLLELSEEPRTSSPSTWGREKGDREPQDVFFSRGWGQKSALVQAQQCFT